MTGAMPAPADPAPARGPAPAVVSVCTACRPGDMDAAEPQGAAFAAALTAALADRPDIHVCPADCLAVCRRPATLAFSGLARWTYVVADLTDIADAAAFARAYADSPNGIVAWRERPLAIRKGVVARVPPLFLDMIR